MLIEKIAALLDGLNGEELQRLPPAHLRRFADLLYRWHVRAETAAGGSPFPSVRRTKAEPKASGVLAHLENGDRGE